MWLAVLINFTVIISVILFLDFKFANPSQDDSTEQKLTASDSEGTERLKRP
jgi:hypothetical protein